MEKNRELNQVGLQTLFEHVSAKATVKVGTVTIMPGERVPELGHSNHEENEYSFILEGEIEGESGGNPFRVQEADAAFIPAHEEHWSVNNGDSPCRIFWMLVKET